MKAIIQLELKNKNALSILKSLEKAKIIRLFTNDKQPSISLTHYKGTISPERTIELVNEIEKSRSEWDERTT
jgi:hypothetical protein